MKRRSYKTEALKWKRAALHLEERICAVRFGLTCGDDVSDAFRMRVAAGVLDRAIKDFVRDFPPDDDEEGWDPTRV